MGDLSRVVVGVVVYEEDLFEGKEFSEVRMNYQSV